MEKLKEFLSSMGFGRNEIEVYVALVGLGASSVLDISKKVKIHRSNIYEALEKLFEAGLVLKVDKPKKNLFRPASGSLIGLFA